jgi:hypothetical protein
MNGAEGFHMKRRLTRAISVALVCLLAAGCASVRLEPTTGPWRVQGEGSDRTATYRTGDVETVVRLAGPDGEFPLVATLLNYGPAPLAVRIVPRFKCPDDATIGEVSGAGTSSGPAAPLGRTDELLIPAALDGAPGALHVALRRDPARGGEPRSAPALEDSHADATYELVVRTESGEVWTPMRFGVERIVKGGTAVKVAVAVVIVAAVVVVLVCAFTGKGGHSSGFRTSWPSSDSASTSPPPSPPPSGPESKRRKPRRTP